MKLIELKKWMESYPSASAAARALGISSQRLSGITRTSKNVWYVLEAGDGLELLLQAHKNKAP